MPPSQGAKVVKLNLVPPRIAPGGVSADAQRMAGAGTQIVLQFRALPYLPLHEKWTARITEFALNRFFCDVQERGPFRRWQHIHSFEPGLIGGQEGTLIRDLVEYEVGFGFIGRTLETLVFQRLLRSTFEYRKQALQRIFS